MMQVFMSRELLAAIDEAAAMWTSRFAVGSKPNRSDFVRRACLAYVEEVAPGIADDITELI
jgi:hypothetical protein